MLHQHVNTQQAYEIAEQSLRDVGIADPDRRLHEYPHQMSGGMRQRVMIAMALSCKPKLLIADEPTTALDVTIQAQILELLRKLQRETGMAILLITHDLGVVAENADVVGVMYASRIVEYATVEELFDQPQHPYTEGLFRSVPKLGAHERAARRRSPARCRTRRSSRAAASSTRAATRTRAAGGAGAGRRTTVEIASRRRDGSACCGAARRTSRTLREVAAAALGGVSSDRRVRQRAGHDARARPPARGRRPSVDRAATAQADREAGAVERE